MQTLPLIVLSPPLIAPLIPPLIPVEGPRPGEQYRFHFDMSKCIGCKCCVVACNEQNGNPAAIHWRRVGEIEGGWYPETRRHYLSMGCNHCLEPSCLTGCPTGAYTKDAATGLVLQNPEACIGCQYCTWNCSYGVPQYNAERGVVGKCDMCYGRLQEGREPACVNACPEGAIRVEVVNIQEWKMQYASTANAPGLPSAEDSISTTRVTLPAHMPPDIGRVDAYRLKPEQPHWPLVFMTVLTQLSAFAFLAIWFMEMLGPGRRLPLTVAALASFSVGAMALAASTLHLGRPIHAWHALKMWKRSWLSREVLAFSLFAIVASVYAAQLAGRFPGVAAVGGLTALLGLAGIAASAWIYRVPARPSWNNKYTVADFYLTGAILGPLFVACLLAWTPDVTGPAWLRTAAAAASAAQLLNLARRFLDLTRGEEFELQASARLLSGPLRNRLLWRAALLAAGGIVFPLRVPGPAGAAAALILALGAELLGRHLFFVSAVPKSMASPYHVAEAA